MRFPFLAVTAAPMVLAVMFDAANAQDGWLKQTQHWSGLIKESGKRALAPKSKVSGTGYLNNQDAFEKLFDAWGLKDKPPKIDFKKQVAFVQTSDGPNLPRAFFKLDAAGNLTAGFKQNEKGGPGFGYSIDILDRTGIRSYQGKPLE